MVTAVYLDFQHATGFTCYALSATLLGAKLTEL